VNARVGGTASHTLHATTLTTAKPTNARCVMSSRRDWYVPRSVCNGRWGWVEGDEEIAVHARVGGTASHTLHATCHDPTTAKPTIASCVMIFGRDWYVPRSV
jgi:hypothetical protein